MTLIYSKIFPHFPLLVSSHRRQLEASISALSEWRPEKLFFISSFSFSLIIFFPYSFARLFKKYHDEIYPARLVFISFLSSQMDEGQMIRSLKQTAPEIKPMQFRFDYSRPDLTKLDNVFGLLSTEMDTFTEEVDKLEKTINENGLASALDNMKV